MDLNSILNQVLDVAKNSASKLETGNQTIDSLTKVGGGAALGGLLSMILGRSGGASLAKLGSLAVLGNLAYQAYQNYQKSQQSSQPNISENAFDVLNSSNHVDAGELILRTMIAAAAADGEITEDEKQTIANEAGNNPELAQWLEQEIQAQGYSVKDIYIAEYKDEKVVVYPYERKHRPQIVSTLKSKTAHTKDKLKSKL